MKPEIAAWKSYPSEIHLAIDEATHALGRAKSSLAVVRGLKKKSGATDAADVDLVVVIDGLEKALLKLEFEKNQRDGQ